ncbi:MAG TPA: hypothetical protein VF444_11375 [Pseudonocardiaceae bacterium]
MTEGSTPSGDSADSGSLSNQSSYLDEINAEAAEKQARDVQFVNSVNDMVIFGNPTALAQFLAQQGARAGKGFVFSPQQIQEVLDDLQAVLLNLQRDLQLARRAHDAINAPSPDPVSLMYEKNARDLTARNMEAVESHYNAIRDYHDKLAAAKDNYMQTEGLTKDQWNRLASGLDA